MAYLGNTPTKVPLSSSDLNDSIITSAKIVDGTIALADLSATGTKNSTTFLRGDNTFATVVSGILQVKKTLITSTISTTCSNSGYTDVSGLSVSITPTSSSSEILILGMINSSSVTSTNDRIRYKLLRGSTDIAVPTSIGSRQSSIIAVEYDTDGFEPSNQSLVWWDSPATTSSTTYKFQVTTNTASSVTAYINRSPNDADNVDNARTVSSIVAIEISNSIL